MFKKNVPVLKSYHITLDTYLIEPIMCGEKIYSYVYDKKGEFIVERKPFYIVRRSCDVLGYNYKSAIKFSKEFFGKDKHKLPILIAHDGKPNILFPIYSPTSPNNIWVGLHGIANIGVNKHPSEITLLDGKEKTLPVSITSLNSQYVYATMLYKYSSQLKMMIQNKTS
ncbi:competence protein ComK [Lysinibacillus sp. SGAir0095]|uniref:competence protein ComK n=1 Tax=Lysinibacillus sp. SGAir0095 TaxID=2070463 RepID=UPI0010CD5F1B|nr:competence protein ComK [Lysinibacillus sp. SGAir0095]QCR31552.1 hypothetical protein C1N55_04935 [Lysinibacillus sp. SGAir0095]